MLKLNMNEFMILSLIFKNVVSICFPDEDLIECMKKKYRNNSIENIESTEVNDADDYEYYDDNGTDVVVRSSMITGRYCFATAGYSGTCRYSKHCRRRNYSYSRTCGWNHICCEERRTKKKGNQRKTFTTTRRPSYSWKQTTKSWRTTSSSRPWRSSSSRPWYQPSTARTTKKPMRSEVCGAPLLSPFIWKGKEAAEGQFPFMVSFVYKRSRSDWENFCGGVLVDRKHVLTAAHCFDSVAESEWRHSESIDVRTGQTDLDTAEEWNTAANIESVSIHPGYKKRRGSTVSPDNDIAIVTLDTEISRFVIQNYV